MSIAPIYKITDGTTSVSFLTGVFKLNSWPPKIAQPKGGGTFLDSPLADGRRLTARVFGNVIEENTFQVVAGFEDLMYKEVQDLRRLLEKAVAFWITDWQTEPVWLEVRGQNETNTRYAIVHNWSTPGDDDPFGVSFVQPVMPGAVIMENWLLLLERGDWEPSAPTGETCVEMARAVTVGKPGTEASANYTVNAAARDAEVNPVGTISTTGTTLTFGATLDSTIGMIFQTIAVPQGATIKSAFLRFVAAAADVGQDMNAIIRGELSTTAGAGYTTWTNFVQRPRTGASKPWNSIPSWVSGNTYDTPDITNIVQEIVDQASWVANNHMGFFVANDDSTAGADRVASSWDHAANNPPMLYLEWYTADHTVGRSTAICLNENYIANKNNLAQLTHIFVDDGGVFGANLLAGNPPYNLTPAATAAADVTYFGIESADGNGGPFGSLIFDISQVYIPDFPGVFWEYHDGAGPWVQLTNLTDETDAFGTNQVSWTNTGVNGMFWNQQRGTAWTTVAVNGVTGWWVRGRITGAIAGVQPPIQANRHVYTLNWPDLDIDEAQVLGDLPALAHTKVYNRSAGWIGLVPALGSNRVLAAIRSESRGADFRMFINLADEQNLAGIAIKTPPATVTFVDDVTSSTGRATYYNPTGVDAMTDVCFVVLNNIIAGDYYGSFHAYLRLRQVGGAAGDFAARLSVRTTYGGLLYQGDTYVLDTKTAAGDEPRWLLFDVGPVETVPPQLFAEGELTNELEISIGLSNDNAAPGDLYLMDLVLLPTDEWASDSEDYTLGTAGTLAREVDNTLRLLDIDSIGNPRYSRRSLLRRDDTIESVNALWAYRSNGLSIFQANADQRIFFLSSRYFESSSVGFWESNPATARTIQSFSRARYFSSRGNR